MHPFPREDSILGRLSQSTETVEVGGLSDAL